MDIPIEEGSPSVVNETDQSAGKFPSVLSSSRDPADTNVSSLSDLQDKHPEGVPLQLKCRLPTRLCHLILPQLPSLI